MKVISGIFLGFGSITLAVCYLFSLLEPWGNGQLFKIYVFACLFLLGSIASSLLVLASKK